MQADVSRHSFAKQPSASLKADLPVDLQHLITQLRDVAVPLDRSTPVLGDVSAEIAALAELPPAHLFPRARYQEGGMAGLLLFAGLWSRAHELVDDSQMPDGCYWHAIVHRMEPDTRNSDYWFRQVGQHTLFPPVLSAARRLAASHPELRLRFDSEWNPLGFNAWCEQSRHEPQSKRSSLIAAIHSAECHLLWNYSMSNKSEEQVDG
jgi:hypothetical protein